MSVIHQICKDEQGQDYLYAILIHASGQFIKSGLKINPIKTDIQSLGAYLSYGKRYTYAAITGCQVGDPDNDGETEMQKIRTDEEELKLKEAQLAKVRAGLRN